MCSTASPRPPRRRGGGLRPDRPRRRHQPPPPPPAPPCPPPPPPTTSSGSTPNPTCPASTAASATTTSPTTSSLLLPPSPPPVPVTRSPPATSLSFPGLIGAPALTEVAGLWASTDDAVVCRHPGTEFRVAVCGFSPCFAYRTGLGEGLAVPP